MTTTTDMTEVLDRSRACLDSTVRDMLSQGRTVRSRNADGEYAIVLTGDRAVVDTKTGKRLDGIADERADWTIVIVDFTFRNVAAADASGEPELRFYAPVYARDGLRVGTIAVNASPDGWRTTDAGWVATRVLPFTSLRAGDRFSERETDGDRVVVFRAESDADNAGRVVSVVEATGEQRVFDLGPDYLAFRHV